MDHLKILRESMSDPWIIGSQSLVYKISYSDSQYHQHLITTHRYGTLSLEQTISRNPLPRFSLAAGNKIRDRVFDDPVYTLEGWHRDEAERKIRVVS